jgi:uncharacterized BrkB/YihY/UPF0761 family membrane protein
MKYFLLLCFVAVLSIESIAQRDPNQLLYALKVEKYRKLKSTGQTLTVTGGILVIVGVSMIIKAASSTSANYSSGTQQSSLTNAETNGLLVYFLGAASLGTGIPLWIVGSHQQRKYEHKFETISVGFNIAPQNTGLALRYRF